MAEQWLPNTSHMCLDAKRFSLKVVFGTSYNSKLLM